MIRQSDDNVSDFRRESYVGGGFNAGECRAEDFRDERAGIGYELGEYSGVRGVYVRIWRGGGGRWGEDEGVCRTAFYGGDVGNGAVGVGERCCAGGLSILYLRRREGNVITIGTYMYLGPRWMPSAIDCN